jgi:hypothetical protein
VRERRSLSKPHGRSREEHLRPCARPRQPSLPIVPVTASRVIINREGRLLTGGCMMRDCVPASRLFSSTQHSASRVVCRRLCTSSRFRQCCARDRIHSRRCRAAPGKSLIQSTSALQNIPTFVRRCCCGSKSEMGAIKACWTAPPFSRLQRIISQRTLHIDFSASAHGIFLTAYITAPIPQFETTFCCMQLQNPACNGAVEMPQCVQLRLCPGVKRSRLVSKC